VKKKILLLKKEERENSCAQEKNLAARFFLFVTMLRIFFLFSQHKTFLQYNT